MPRIEPFHSLATVFRRAWLAIALFAWVAWPAAARAETTACTVLGALPIAVGAPGNYCLDHDYAQAFDYFAVNITGNDITLDCNGHRLRNTNAANAYPGVDVGGSLSHVVVRNCVIDGFHDGIIFSNGGGNGARNSIARDNTILHFRQQGIVGWGSSLLIEGNRISQALGDDNGGAIGIYLISIDANGSGSVIRNNTIVDFTPAPSGAANAVAGIWIGNVRNTEISGNTVANLNARTGQCAWAVYGSDPTGTRVTGNVLLSVPQPVAAPYDGSQCGISLYGTAQEQATNVCDDNVVGHYGAIYGCVSAGNTGF
jgi:hypothetical protein